MGNQSPQSKDTVIQVRCAPREKRRWERFARGRGLTLSALTRIALNAATEDKQ